VGTFTAHREDWELSKRIIDQSEIKLAINTLKPFKSAGTDEIVPALLQQEVDYLTTHLCRIFRDAWQGDLYPQPGGKLK
jgi:hypothetical protein